MSVAKVEYLKLLSSEFALGVASSLGFFLDALGGQGVRKLVSDSGGYFVSESEIGSTDLIID